jgi:hypothetical protein
MDTLRAVVVRPIDAGHEVYVRDLPTDDLLSELQGEVGGLIEAVTVNGAVMYINEDGKGLGLPINDIASIIAHADSSIAYHDMIVGTAVFVGPTDRHGDDTAITPAAKQRVYEIAGVL